MENKSHDAHRFAAIHYRYIEVFLVVTMKNRSFHMQGILLTRHCQVEVISRIKENPQEEEQVIVELDIV